MVDAECGRSLSATKVLPMSENEHLPCRRCDESIRIDTTECPYCGARNYSVRQYKLGAVIWSILGVVLSTFLALIYPIFLVAVLVVPVVVAILSYRRIRSRRHREREAGVA